MLDMPFDSFLRNSFVDMREGDDPLFAVTRAGVVMARLDGYAIIPIERYNALIAGNVVARRSPADAEPVPVPSLEYMSRGETVLNHSAEAHSRGAVMRGAVNKDKAGPE